MLGSRIASLRNKEGLSQAALATKLNISPSTIGMYEQGRREPPVDMLIALSREFSVSVDYLLTGDTSSQQNRTVDTFSREKLIVLIAAQLANDY